MAPIKLVSSSYSSCLPTKYDKQQSSLAANPPLFSISIVLSLQRGQLKFFDNYIQTHQMKSPSQDCFLNKCFLCEKVKKKLKVTQKKTKPYGFFIFII
jgi:hypothetical protein